MNFFTHTCFKLFSVIITFLFSLPSFYAQETLKELALTQQIEASSTVIEGRVIAKESYWNSDYTNIYTVNTIKVFKVFKGENSKIIEVITPGGIIGDKAQISKPSLQLRNNDIGIFTLVNAHNKLVSNKTKVLYYEPFGSVQGFYKYDLNKNVATNPFSKKSKIETSFYNEIEQLTNIKYTEIDYFNVADAHAKAKQSKALLVPSNVSFSPSTISAGTGSELIISGNDFGSVKGKVAFRNADDGGASYIDALNSQVTWSPTQITVQVPSFAGTGTIRVTDSNGDFYETTNELTVTHALLNQVSNGIAYPVQAYNTNGNGGFTWQKNTSFTANNDVNTAFTTALDAWRCVTGVHWVVGNDTNTAIAANDMVNTIAFSALPEGNLGITTYYLDSCNNGTDWVVQEIDIIFDNTASTPWNFNPNSNTTGFEYDFQSVVLHELGHAHLLNHVIDNDDVMDFNIGITQESRNLSNRNLEAANSIQTKNTTHIICALPLMTNYNCATASIADDALFNEIHIYPNPSSGQFFVKNGASTNIDKVVIYDVSGRLISSINVLNTSEIIPINILGITTGIYFINLHDKNRIITKKMTVE